MENRKIKQIDKLIDPIGIETIISILGLSIGIVSAMHQFGVFGSNRKKLAKSFKLLYKQTLSVHNCLDEVILVIQRHSRYSIDNASIIGRRLTLSDSLFDLKERDYQKWIDIKETIFQISKDTYEIISKIRKVYTDYEGDESYEIMNKSVFCQI
jgi:hypothetical protein